MSYLEQVKKNLAGADIQAIITVKMAIDWELFKRLAPWLAGLGTVIFMVYMMWRAKQ